MMADIYAKATCVTIWLGVEDEYSTRALDTTERIAAWQKAANPEFDHDNYWPIPDEPDELSVADARAVALFFARSYFSRIWVIQEVASASMIKAYCGRRIISWDDLLRASFHIYRHRWNTRIVRKGLPEVLAADATIHAFAIQPYKVHRMRVRSFAGELLLEANLYLSWNSEATDLRDKVFGTLGLVTNTVRHKLEATACDDRSLRQSLQCELKELAALVDYRKPIAEVYAATTRLAIKYPRRSDNSLDVLTMVNGELAHDIGEHPSWVPNLSSYPTNGLTGMGSPRPDGTLLYCASASRTFTPGPLNFPDSQTLVVNSFCLDQAQNCSSFTKASTNVAGRLQWYELAAKAHGSCHSSRQQPYEVLWRTLCHDLSKFKTPAPDSTGHSFLHWIETDARQWLLPEDRDAFSRLLLQLDSKASADRLECFVHSVESIQPSRCSAHSFSSLILHLLAQSSATLSIFQPYQ
jgi:hypothetical protein